MGHPRKKKRVGAALARLHAKYYSSSVAGGTAATKDELKFTDTQKDCGKEYLLDLLMLSDHMYDGPKRPFTNGDKLLLSELKDRVSSWETTGTKLSAGDGLLSGLSDTDIAEAATASITFSDKPNETSTITITDAAGTSVVFEIDDTGDGVTGSNVAVTQIAENGGGGDGTAVDLAAKINASALAITAAAPGSGVLNLTQQTAGSDGNTAFAFNSYSHWNGNVTGTLVKRFTGGVAAVAAAGTHALHYYDERASTTKGGGTVITDDTGILFDMAGPAVKYHQDFNGISRGAEGGSGTKVYLTIKPESWASGKAVNMSLYGSLAAEDSMRVYGLQGTTLTAITGMSVVTGSAAASQTPGGTTSTTVCDYKASLDHAASNQDGICVEFLHKPQASDSSTTTRLPFSGSLTDDGSTLATGNALGSTGLGFALSWNVQTASTS